MCASGERTTINSQYAHTYDFNDAEWRKKMKARHALYLGLVIAGASFFICGSSTLGLILEGLGLIPLLISAIIEIATEK